MHGSHREAYRKGPTWRGFQLVAPDRRGGPPRNPDRPCWKSVGRRWDGLTPHVVRSDPSRRRDRRSSIAARAASRICSCRANTYGSPSASCEVVVTDSTLRCRIEVLLAVGRNTVYREFGCNPSMTMIVPLSGPTRPTRVETESRSAQADFAYLPQSNPVASMARPGPPSHPCLLVYLWLNGGAPTRLHDAAVKPM